MFKKVRREEIKVPADMNYLAELRDFITQTGRKFGVSEQIINSFKMAIDEAGTNIIRHAYRDWEGYITVRIIIREKSVTVCLIDQGHTYDPRLSKDPDLKRYVDIGKKGGLGIFIIRRLVDEIDYHKTVEGNELKLTKLRDSGARPHLYMPALGFSMKTRFSLIASGVLTLILSTLFVINYIHQEKGIFQGSIDAGRVFAKAAAHNSVDFLANSETWELARISAEIHRDHTDLVREVFIVDKKHIIQGAYLTEKILEIFKIPDGASKKSDDVFEFRLSGYGPVYDVVQPVILKANNVDEHLGNVHILLNEKYIDKLISRARIKAVIFFFVILIGGYAGIFWLVYVTVSPFKRLSNWVKALGRDEVQDEMEFDPSDEVGEIAKAFSDITEKFRKSQEDLAEQERLQKEMQVAQEIQQTLLPSSFPEVEGFDLASYYEAAKEVGGDYFDFVQVDQDTLGIVVADVSGKGVPGSLVMTMIRTALRTEARGNRDAADVLAKVNEFVMNDMKRGMFVTVFYIILDSKKRIINYASAGHNPMILYRGRTKKSYYLNPKGFPIGIKLPDPALFRKSITSDRLKLQEDDVLIAYTDGVTEAMNPQRECFGEERLLSAIRRYEGLKVEPLVDKIHDEITIFTGGQAQSDDITLVAIREKMKAEDVIFSRRKKLFELVNKQKMSVKDACKETGLSKSVYYKYKKKYEKEGEKALKEKSVRSEVEVKHISIEDKAKLYDIIKKHPEFGAKKISEELNTENYEFTVIPEAVIYEGLKREKLNTKELRMAYVAKGSKGKRMKRPGTPFISIDGEVVIKPEKPELRPKLPVFNSDNMDKEEASVNREENHAADDADFSFQEQVESHGDEFSDTSTDSTSISEDELQGENIFSDEMLVDDSLLFDDSASNIRDIKETGEDIFNSSFFEDEITSSVAGDLFGEELGGDESAEEANDNDLPGSKDSFVDMMKDLGFDRTTVLSGGGEVKEKQKESAVKELNVKRYVESGLWFYKQGLYNKARDEFLKAINEDPHYLEASQYLGDTFFRLGKLDKAREIYEKVRGLDPDNINVLENLGVIMANQGDYKKAVWLWGEVLKLNPSRKDIIGRIQHLQKLIRQKYS